ncbi:hypothetical protein [Lactiplantibacillus carotarum]|uniref:hypothetical protein n=1 Tax=Lactiplantibacillus carotarum TaxID=2993456 RepID=UPI00298EE8C4|nr:hypothetical protein [Lactiplantibacillus carotarum]
MEKTYTQKEVSDVLMIIAEPLALVYGNMKAARDEHHDLDLYFISQRIPEIESAFRTIGVDVQEMAEIAMKGARNRG